MDINQQVGLILDEVSIFRSVLNRDEDGSRPLQPDIRLRYKHQIAARMNQVNILLEDLYKSKNMKPKFN